MQSTNLTCTQTDLTRNPWRSPVPKALSNRNGRRVWKGGKRSLSYNGQVESHGCESRIRLDVDSCSFCCALLDGAVSDSEVGLEVSDASLSVASLLCLFSPRAYDCWLNSNKDALNLFTRTSVALNGSWFPIAFYSVHDHIRGCRLISKKEGYDDGQEWLVAHTATYTRIAITDSRNSNLKSFSVWFTVPRSRRQTRVTVKYVTRARRTGGGRKEAREMTDEVAERMNCTKSLRNIHGQSLHVVPESLSPPEGLVKDTNASCRIELSRWSIEWFLTRNWLSKKVLVNIEIDPKVKAQTFPRKQEPWTQRQLQRQRQMDLRQRGRCQQLFATCGSWPGLQSQPSESDSLRNRNERNQRLSGGYSTHRLSKGSFGVFKWTL